MIQRYIGPVRVDDWLMLLFDNPLHVNMNPMLWFLDLQRVSSLLLLEYYLLQHGSSFLLL